MTAIIVQRMKVKRMKNKLKYFYIVCLIGISYLLGVVSKPKLTTPMNVILYDRTNKAIMQYETYPEIENGTLRLLDSDLLYQEHDCEWDNMVRGD